MTSIKVQKLTIQGSNTFNEDSLIINDHLAIYGVVDGATSMVPYRGPNGETGGLLASRLISEHLESLTGDSAEQPLYSAVLEANRKLRESMEKSGINVEDKRELWTAGIAVVKITDHYVEFAQAGDCMLVAYYGDGSIRVLTQDQVAPLDSLTRSKWVEGIEKGLSSPLELREYVSPQIQQNRLSLNTLNGYTVISGEPEVADLLEYGRMNRIRLSGLLMVTDGLFLPTKKGEKGATIEQLAERIKTDGLANYAKWLVELEENDPECTQYPRFKKSDDKTAVWIEFTGD
ncbi:protein phosphatase 2C domain-containing protein [Paenibacillus senegalensis]|uniref:protein phosphatase 2C domain-containing protein n=1 Tax=Paenibacillus senegalensis TaxID=1465766 RepID=UPI000289BC47|nr:protein phosphatase 2C domain-containing protein [Paenibacillus senegalensis]